MTRHEALEALERVLNEGGDADDVIRSALEILAGLYSWVAILFVEDGKLVAGPSAGSVDTGDERRTDVLFQGMKVGELAAPAPADDATFLARFAELLAPYCLVGWDTSGEAWEP